MNVVPRLILLAGGLVFVALAYPGLLTLDSIDQLTEARAGYFTDAHPPAMAALWGVLDAILAGPFLMLLLQVGTFLASAYLVLRRALAPRTAAIAACLVLFFPPIANPMSFIWKDSLMAGLCLLGAGLLLDGRRGARYGALACFALATAVKYTGMAATLPLVVLLWDRRRVVVPLLVWAGVTAAAMLANRLLVDRPMYFWHSSVAVADICGVIAKAPDTPDETLRRPLAGTGLVVESGIQARCRAVEVSRDTQTLVVGDKRLWNLPFTGTTPAPEAQRTAVGEAWWHFVLGDPVAYARTRLGYFLDVLGVTYKSYSAVPPRIMKYPGFLANLGLEARSTWWQNRWSAFHKWVWRNTPLFTPWVYLLVALLLAYAARRDRIALGVLASGVVSELALLPIVVSPDYRYSHWTITCTVIAAVMAVARLLAARAAVARGTADTPVASPRA